MSEPYAGELGRARLAALRGEIDEALPVIVRHAEAGDDGAAASASELSAYLALWDDAIAQAARLLANPYAVYAGNVFHELVLLLGRAGRETGAWREIARIADAASARIEADLQANPWGFPAVKLEAAERTLLLVLARLGEYALGEGSIRSHGDLDVFTPKHPEPRRDLFDAAMKLKRNRDPARRLVFACMYHLDDEMIRLFGEGGGTVGFDRAVAVAKAFLRAGDQDGALGAVRANWADWTPVDRAQVAPLVLLTDRDLSRLVTPHRAADLLRRPRAAHLWR